MVSLLVGRGLVGTERDVGGGMEGAGGLLLALVTNQIPPISRGTNNKNRQGPERVLDESSLKIPKTTTETRSSNTTPQQPDLEDVLLRLARLVMMKSPGESQATQSLS